MSKFLQKILTCALLSGLFLVLVPVQYADASAGNSCQIGQIVVQKTSNTTPIHIDFTTRGDKGVGYYHWEFDDPSNPVHASASGSTSSKGHLYNQPKTYSIVITGYRSYKAFMNHQACSTKSVKLTLVKKATQAKTTWIWPTNGKVISVVGWRKQPVIGVWRWHNGIDIANKIGTPIMAAKDGKVVYVGSGCHSSASNCGGGYGNWISIRHDNNLYSVYAHLSKINVKVGQSVKAGQKIGEMGNTGLTNTVHLHFGIGYSGFEVNDHSKIVDPLKILPTTI